MKESLGTIIVLKRVKIMVSDEYLLSETTGYMNKDA